MRIGILFGGPSREREISFAGGRTVFDNLNKTLFTPVPIFIDSLHNFILLDWQYIYKGSIRDFYPPAEFIPKSEIPFQPYIENLDKLSSEELDQLIASVGKRIDPAQLSQHIDFAFLALHGRFGEDGVIQGLLEFQQIPYSGSGIASSALGMNKSLQKRIMAEMQFPSPVFKSIKREIWLKSKNKETLLQNLIVSPGLPLVIRPANQGSSIGVSIIHEASISELSKAIDHAFFIRYIHFEEWSVMQKDEKVSFIKSLSDIRESIGLPVIAENTCISNPDDLLTFIDAYFNQSSDPLVLESTDSESDVIAEAFIDGKEFSCIVIKNTDGSAISLPPTEIIKGKEVFDYRSKYLAGLSRKITPINLPTNQVENIRKACEKLFNLFGFNVYARIDGFINDKGAIYLNDPNTTSGMLPSSFFFHQAAEIGLNPSQFLTYIVRTSIAERIENSTSHTHFGKLISSLDLAIEQLHRQEQEKIKVAVVLGGYSTERHISVESGRNIFEKLASSKKYEPIPVFLTGNEAGFTLYKIPVNILLKDNADDIVSKIKGYKKDELIEQIRVLAESVTSKYAFTDYHFEPEKISIENLSKEVDFVFIALHGRPGEDGVLQKELEKYSIPYNGSGPDSSAVTINKYTTNRLLAENGFLVADQMIIKNSVWENNQNYTIQQIEEIFKYPFIAKPMDDGCSSAVKKIKHRDDLLNYAEGVFRKEEHLSESLFKRLQLKPKEEFPRKKEMLIESLITKEKADFFLEITGGMLIDTNDRHDLHYEAFEPSETLAGEEVLSLEEKFLAGQGQNITPARMGKTQKEYEKISSVVKKDLIQAARILGVVGYCRIDAFVRGYQDGKIETIIIEVNSLPGMTPATCIFHQAAINGYKPYDFIDRIIEFGFKRNKVKIC